jgi:hypothetical protein
MAVGIRHADHVAPSNPQKLELTSKTSGGRSVGIVSSRAQAKEFSLVLVDIREYIRHMRENYSISIWIQRIDTSYNISATLLYLEAST